ncbi:hypothetical protein BDR22DRAFT_893155 [Usnea florida]
MSAKPMSSQSAAKVALFLAATAWLLKSETQLTGQGKLTSPLTAAIPASTQPTTTSSTPSDCNVNSRGAFYSVSEASVTGKPVHDMARKWPATTSEESRL